MYNHIRQREPQEWSPALSHRLCTLRPTQPGGQGTKQGYPVGDCLNARAQSDVGNLYRSTSIPVHWQLDHSEKPRRASAKHTRETSMSNTQKRDSVWTPSNAKHPSTKTRPPKTAASSKKNKRHPSHPQREISSRTRKKTVTKNRLTQSWSS